MHKLTRYPGQLDRLVHRDLTSRQQRHHCSPRISVLWHLTNVKQQIVGQQRIPIAYEMQEVIAAQAQIANALRLPTAQRYPHRASRIAPAPFFRLGRTPSAAERGPASEARPSAAPSRNDTPMSLQALATPSQEPAAPRNTRISKRLSEAIRLLTTGECATQKAAAERVGMNYTHLCEALKKPHVRVFIERRSRETIAAGLMRASARLNELVDASSEHVSLDATKHVLGIAGIKPASDPQVSVNIELKAGYVIDLSDKPGPVVDVVRADAPARNQGGSDA